MYVSGPYPRVDYAEKARKDAEDAYRAKLPKDTPHSVMNGLYFPVTKVPREHP